MPASMSGLFMSERGILFVKYADNQSDEEWRRGMFQKSAITAE